MGGAVMGGWGGLFRLEMASLVPLGRLSHSTIYKAGAGGEWRSGGGGGGEEGRCLNLVTVLQNQIRCQRLGAHTSSNIHFITAAFEKKKKTGPVVRRHRFPCDNSASPPLQQ